MARTRERRRPGEAAAIAVADRMFQALVVLRLVLLAHAVYWTGFRRFDNFQEKTGGVVCLVLMVLWTLFAIWAYDDRARRRSWLLVTDLALAVGIMASSPWLKGEGFEATVPGYWIVGAMIAWAIHWRFLGGLVAAAALSVTDLSIRQDIEQTNLGNVFLLLVAGPIVGYLCGSFQRMAYEREVAEHAAAVASERARLARAVHDGVLQVLALVQRRGAELGGEAAELGRLAGEQEDALRALIRQQDAVGSPSSLGAANGDQEVDIAAELETLGARRPPVTSVVTPGEPVRLPTSAGSELVAAVVEALANVARHVGETAQAWVLVEDLGSSVVVTVRDEGPGIPDGRLDQAASEGRLGVMESIRGRIRDLGGDASLVTAPGQGVEWEFTLPRSEGGA